MKAAIDIGSNSLLLVVVDDEGRVLHDEATVVGLGRGLPDKGVFKPDRMDAAAQVLAAYVARAAELGVPVTQVRAVATSASRRALNAATFFQGVLRQTGLKVEVISGDEEARLTWLGALDGLDLSPGPVLLVDPGGGSTEVIQGEGGVIRARTSLELGTVRLTDALLGYESVDAASFARLRDAVGQVVRGVPLVTPPKTVVATAGTVTTLMAAELGQTVYDGAAVHGATLTIGAIRGWIDRLLEAGPAKRRQLVAVSPERADTLLAGAVILLHVLEHARRSSLRVSDRGLRFGVLADRSRDRPGR